MSRGRNSAAGDSPAIHLPRDETLPEAGGEERQSQYSSRRFALFCSFLFLLSTPTHVFDHVLKAHSCHTRLF